MSQRTNANANSSRNRRDFLRSTTAAGVGLWVVGSGSGVMGKSANDKVNVAIIGVGGRGGAHVDGIPKAGGNIVALCDVDDRNLGQGGRETSRCAQV